MANYNLKTEITEHVAGMEVAPPSAPPAFNSYVGRADAAFVVSYDNNRDSDGDSFDSALYVFNSERPEWQGESAASSHALQIACWVADAEEPDGKRYEEASGAFGKLVLNAPLPRVATSSYVTANSAHQFKLPLAVADQQAVSDGDILLVCGIEGWEADGASRTPGKDLLLVVTGRDTATNYPRTTSINGPKASASAPVCKTPAIPAGTAIQVLPVTAQDLNLTVKDFNISTELPNFVSALVEGLAGFSAFDLGLAEGIIRVHPSLANS